MVKGKDKKVKGNEVKTPDKRKEKAMIKKAVKKERVKRVELKKTKRTGGRQLKKEIKTSRNTRRPKYGELVGNKGLKVRFYGGEVMGTTTGAFEVQKGVKFWEVKCHENKSGFRKGVVYLERKGLLRVPMEYERKVA